MHHLDSVFSRVMSDGRPMWLHGPSGRLLPVVAGGDGDEGASTQDGNEDPGDSTSDAGDKPKTITMTSEQLAQRLARAKPADYDEMKAKAAELDKLKKANQSELERVTEQATEAEQRAFKAEAEALRLRIATKHGITDSDDIELFLTGTDEETLMKQAERLGERTSTTKKNVVPKEGTTPKSAAADDEREAVRGLFGSGG